MRLTRLSPFYTWEAVGPRGCMTQPVWLVLLPHWPTSRALCAEPQQSSDQDQMIYKNHTENKLSVTLHLIKCGFFRINKLGNSAWNWRIRKSFHYAYLDDHFFKSCLKFGFLAIILADRNSMIKMCIYDILEHMDCIVMCLCILICFLYWHGRKIYYRYINLWYYTVNLMSIFKIMWK